ncbi:hypothetical protein JW805_00995 [Roseomonas aeriglobus]|nr:hypothetical protein [Roseomonas aeriglobus]
MSAYYVTAIDRIGWALAVGGAAGGVVAGALAGRSGPNGIMGAAALGTLATWVVLILVAVPIWTWFHHRSRRDPATAALLGSGLGLVLGLFTGALLAALAATMCGAVIGWLMQRVGYRRLF